MIKNIILLWVLIFSVILDFAFSQRSKKGKIPGNIGRYNLIEFSRAFSKDAAIPCLKLSENVCCFKAVLEYTWKGTIFWTPFVNTWKPVPGQSWRTSEVVVPETP